MTRSEEECDHGQIISLCNYHRLRGREEILETILSHIQTIPAAASFDFFVRISGTISLTIRTVKSTLREPISEHSLSGGYVVGFHEIENLSSLAKFNS